MTDALCLMVGLPTGALGGDALRCGGTSGERVGVAGLGVVPVVTGATGGATDWCDDVAGAETEGRAACVDDAAVVDCAEGCTGGCGAATGVDGATAVNRAAGCTGGCGAATGVDGATAVDPAADCIDGRSAVTGVDGAAAADRTECCTDGRGAETGGVCATTVDGVYG